MCGIIGFIDSSLPNSNFLRSCGSNMAKAINHRGPDSSGVWIDEFIGLSFSHQRLSIIDLSPRGNQPMISATGRYVIVFNGEIYNHIEIRENINRKTSHKIKWKGHSDTETILNAIEVFGLIKALNLCVGMFSFGIYDRKEKVLNLARDRFGEKPLYWGKFNNPKNKKDVFLFSSELSAIWEFPGFNKSINQEGLNSFFQLGYVKPPYSIQENIFQLLPGHYLTINLNNIFERNNKKLPESKIWWDSFEKFSKNPKNDCEYFDDNFYELEKLLEQSIVSQSNADVPVGTFLSGGIDSSIVALLLQKNKMSKIKTFNISFPDIDKNEGIYDEGPFAKAIANHIGTDHIEIPLRSSDVIEIIRNITNFYSEPFADSSQIPTFLVCNQAKKNGLKVALTGDGGDELFGGYNRHILIPEIHKLFSKTPDLFRNFSSKILEENFLSNFFLSQEKKQKLSLSIKYSNKIEKLYSKLISNGINTKLLMLNDGLDLKEDLFISSNNKYPISEIIMINDLINYLPNDILVKVDRASMANSLETRAPFLDYRLVEYSWQIPLKYKIVKKGINRIGKWPLRKILSKYIPDNLINRRKNGFSMPIGSWLKGPLKEWSEDLLNSSLIREQNLLDEKYIRNIWDEHLSNKRDNTTKIWTILMWQSWINRWK